MEPKRIALIGPESTGKTTLCKQLAAHFKTRFVPEYARAFLEGNGPKISFDQLLHIAKSQLAHEDVIAYQATGTLFCDTEMINIKVWSEFEFGRCDPWIEEQVHNRPYDLYLLTKPDIPWVVDSLRKLPHKRAELFQVYESLLKKLGRPYFVILGQGPKRLKSAIARL